RAFISDLALAREAEMLDRRADAEAADEPLDAHHARATVHAQRRAFHRRELHREAQVGSFSQRDAGLEIDSRGAHVARPRVAALQLDGKVTFEARLAASWQHVSPALLIANMVSGRAPARAVTAYLFSCDACHVTNRQLMLRDERGIA